MGETGRYVSVPEDWWLGLTDVVDSTAAVSEGRYKSVNVAGASTIAAVSNAVAQDLPLFVFTGDGARFAVPPHHVDAARQALSSTAAWVKRDLDLTLRVGMMPVKDLRAAGYDARVAFHRPAPAVRYALFSGGGLDWAEEQLKQGKIDGLAPGNPDEVDLSGMSCQWGAMQSRKGTILSVVVRSNETTDAKEFATLIEKVVALAEGGGTASPVPEDGPPLKWPGDSIDLDARLHRRGRSVFLQKCKTVFGAIMAIFFFKTDMRLGKFKPSRYRREIAENSDFRKYDDGLMMTVDCADETRSAIESMLADAEAQGLIRFGLHTQDEALMTCFVPTITMDDHVHFIDGAGGGYAEATAALKRKLAPPSQTAPA